jgi:lipopolysaccharide biosynthesis glycosyltransferase
MSSPGGKSFNSKQKDVFHIAFGVDERFVRPMGVTITSIICNNPDLKLAFHVFSPSISDDSRQRLKALEEMYQRPISVHIIEKLFVDQFCDIPLPKHISLAAFTRLLIPAALSNVTDRVLYLDADVICVGGISELALMDISKKIACVVDDVEEKTIEAQCRKFNLTHKKYFNSGVLYINISRWISEEISKKAILTILDVKNKLDFADQDALNIVLDGRASFIDAKWNRQYRLFDQLRNGNKRMDLNEETVFVHFIGVMKPWRQWNPHESKELFVKYQLRSPWADVRLDEDMHYKEMHNLSRFYFKQKEITGGVKWLLKYFVQKYFK